MPIFNFQFYNQELSLLKKINLKRTNEKFMLMEKLQIIIIIIIKFIKSNKLFTEIQIIKKKKKN